MWREMACQSAGDGVYRQHTLMPLAWKLCFNLLDPCLHPMGAQYPNQHMGSVTATLLILHLFC